MAISMFNISVPIFIRHLNGLAHCMKKAQAVYAEKKYDEGTLMIQRLYPDMFTFARQVQQATDHARNCAGALAGGAILEAICRQWPTARVRVADRGLREGVLMDLMRQADREACAVRA